MRPYFIKTPKFFRWIYPKRIWAFPQESNSVYLTFDDGPIPEVTPWVLDILKQFNAKATFFCIGDNTRKHPALFQRILAEGHTIGNHTFHHVNGWKLDTSAYLQEVLRAEAIFKTEDKKVPNKLFFRPPYGKLRSSQAKALQKKGYYIVMWDVLSADFDANVSEEVCLQNVLKHIQPGSIVVFHDSIKAQKNLRYALPKVLEFLNANGLKTSVIR
ncbi:MULTISPECIES: polysaccharide deacetylase family protein [Altibacter]|uniref:polysaccharide deacetylase family protein n=1 Tax=Altibacter TaxID=1535231 RepID=UPI00055311DE|nr:MULTISPECIES: polysaccharide deacetylase family protein [Altibacter]MCW9036738.1 polysaccharide deacetylase family protein [Altibacter sp.]